MRRFDSPGTKIALIITTLVPIGWLLLSDEGRRWTDEFMLQLFGREVATLEIKNLSPAVRREDVLANYPELEFDCRKDASGIVEACHAEVASLNRVPGRFIDFVFRNDSLQMMKFGYQLSYHDQLRSWLEQQLGEVAPVGGGEGATGVLAWQVGGGTLLMPTNVHDHPDAQLIWTSQR